MGEGGTGGKDTESLIREGLLPLLGGKKLTFRRICAGSPLREKKHRGERNLPLGAYLQKSYKTSKETVEFSPGCKGEKEMVVSGRKERSPFYIDLGGRIG